VPASTVAPPTGDPIKIGLINDEGSAQGNTVELRVAAEATAKYLNTEATGIAGRPVEIVSCNEKNDPTAAQSCAQKFVDEGVMAVTGLGGLWGENGIPAIEAAGILNISTAVSANELTCKTCYPIQAGAIGGGAALATYAATVQKVTAASSMVVDIPGAKASRDGFWDGILKKHGVTNIVDVNQDASAADFSPAMVKSTSNNPQAIFVVGDETYCARALQAAQQVGAKASFYAPFACGTEAVTSLPNAEGMFIYSDTVSPDDATNKDAILFRKIMKDYADNYTLKPILAITEVSQIMTLKTMAETLSGTITSAALIAAFDKVEGVPVFAGGQLSTTNQSKIFPHAKSAKSSVLQLKSGKFVMVSDGFIDGTA
jgi:branched-chain amino acid transport system substrate-binding protein